MFEHLNISFFYKILNKKSNDHNGCDILLMQSYCISFEKWEKKRKIWL